MVIFSGKKYHLAPCLDPEESQELGSLLDANGASLVSIQKADFVVSTTLDVPDFDKSGVNAPLATNQEKHVGPILVTPYYVHRSLALGRALATKHFSPDPALFFSGIVACAHELPSQDIEILAGAIDALGGHWSDGYTKEVTHLISGGPAPNSASPTRDENGQVEPDPRDKYSIAMYYRESTHVKIVTPHWFDDSVKLGRALAPEPYEWPEPPILSKNPLGHQDTAASGHKPRNLADEKLSPGKKAYYESIRAAENGQDQKSLLKQVWHKRRILLSTDLNLQHGRRQAIKADINRADGEVIEYSANGGEGTQEEELSLVDSCDVYVCRWRSTRPYCKAFAARKQIGNLAWVFHVGATGALTSPTEHLLHYPIPRQPLDGFGSHCITLTNYTGAAREYLKKMVMLMGAQWTANMSRRNTVLVAAKPEGVKATTAQEWGLAIVNHTWLEDCFVQWRNLSPAQHRYIAFPPGHDWSNCVGDKQLSKTVLDRWAEVFEDPDAEAAHAGETIGAALDAEATEDVPVPMSTDPRSLSSPKERTRTAQVSMNDLAEVEAAISLQNDMDVDAEVLALPDEDADDPGQAIITTKRSVRKSVQDTGSPSPRLPQTSKATPRREIVGRSLSEKDTMHRAVNEEREHRDEETAEEAEVSPTTVTLKGKTSASAKTRVVTAESSDEGSARSSPTPMRRKATTAKAGTSARPKSPVLELSSSEDDLPNSIVKDLKQGSRPTRSSAAKQGGKKNEQAIGSIIDSPSGSSRKRVIDKPSRDVTSKTRMSHRVSDQKADTESDDEGMPPPAVPRSRWPSSSKQPSIPHPKAGGNSKDVVMAHVQLPSPGSKRRGLGSSPSLRVVANEQPAREPRRGTAARSTATRRAEEEDEPETDEGVAAPVSRRIRHTRAGSQTSDTSPMPAESPVRLPSRRSAAVAGTQKTSAMMQDRNLFEKQLKKGKDVLPRGEWEESSRAEKRPKSHGQTAEDEDVLELTDEDEGPSRKKAKGNAKDEVASGSRRKRKENESPGGKSTKTSRKRARADYEDDDVVDDDDDSSRHGPIKVITTSVTFSNGVQEKLKDLGVIWVAEPTQATHLVMTNIKRTPKFLCALPTVRFIVSRAWAEQSAKANRLLPEVDYPIKDRDGEKRLGFVLSEALERAHRNQGRLFRGHEFIMTTNVGKNEEGKRKLVTDVIEANGGQMSKLAATLRNLQNASQRHLISCVEDARVWQPLAKAGLAVHKPEFIFALAMRQELDWYDETERVEGSIVG